MTSGYLHIPSLGGKVTIRGYALQRGALVPKEKRELRTPTHLLWAVCPSPLCASVSVSVQ